MGPDKFNSDDRDKLVDFLNMVARHAQFSLSTEQIIQYFKLLSHMQKSILPKVQNHILEVERLIEPEEDYKED